MKKFFSLLLALIMCIPFSNVAFATEMPAVKATTVEFTVDANSESAIMPRIWNQVSYTLNSQTITYGLRFNVPDRYFAYEASAVAANGGTVTSGHFAVALMADAVTLIASSSGNADGTVYKNDWIDLGSGGNYLFKVCNYTNTAITVSITYYSWA